MRHFSDLAFTRRSIRKFQDRDIPLGEVEELVKVAVSAPSGCNSQCWRFVVVKDKELMQRMAAAAMQKISEAVAVIQPELPAEYLAAKQKAVGFFTKAPVVIAIFLTPYQYYDPVLEGALQKSGIRDAGLMEVFAWPDVLSIGAAAQNLLLAAHEKGYGACWMNEPAIAGAEIGKILQEPAAHRLISLIPIGWPAYTPREKKMKEFSQVFSVFPGIT